MKIPPRSMTVCLVRLIIGILLWPAASFTAHAQETAPVSTRTMPAKILLKADDFRGVNPNWQRFLAIIDRRGLHASIGIICDSLEKVTPPTVQWVKDVRAGGKIEFWNHGFDHKQWKENDRTLQEFAGPTYEQQKEHLTHCDTLVREKLGFSFQTFGAPFNATDAATVKVLLEEPNIKVWLYGDKKQPAGKVVLDRVPEVNIENPIFHPSVEKFKTGYHQNPQRDFFLIQGHPPMWKDADFVEFELILDFLVQEKAVFVTPSEYAHLPLP